MRVLDKATCASFEYLHLRRQPNYRDLCNKSYSNELGRICQGVGTDDTGINEHVPGTDASFVIRLKYIPAERIKDINYIKVVCEFKPQKADPNRTRITICGNLI